MKNNYLIHIKASDDSKTYNFDFIAIAKNVENMKNAIDSTIQNNAELLQDKNWTVCSISKIDNSVDIDDFRSKEEQTND